MFRPVVYCRYCQKNQWQANMRNLLNRANRDRKIFMRAVEKHERDWGSESYTGRPTLTQILDAPVVAFWHPSGSDPDMRTTITLHDDINDISAYVTQLVLHTTRERLPLVRLWRVFKGKREVKIKGVKVDFEYVGGG